jgi:hypothetical protein
MDMKASGVLDVPLSLPYPKFNFITFIFVRFNRMQVQSIDSFNFGYRQSDNKVRELIAVKVFHTSLLNTTVVAFKALPLVSYASMPAPSLPFKTILELVLWNGLQSCLCFTPDVINVNKIPSFQYLFIFGNCKKSLGARPGE